VLSTQILAEDLDAQQVTDVFGFSPLITGKGNLNLKLDGGGRSMQGLVSNLSGGGILSMENSRFSGVTTGGFANILEMSDNEEFEISSDTVLPVAKTSMQNGSFAIRELSTPFTINGGKIGIRNLSMEDDQGSIDGGMELSLVDLETELELTIAPNPGEEGLAAAEPEASFTWSGTPGDISVSVDTSALQGYLSLRAYEREQRRVEILQAKALENQRLRREVILANTRINYRDRERARELRQLEELQKKLEEERLQREEAEKAARAEEARLQEEAESEAPVVIENLEPIEPQAAEPQIQPTQPQARTAREAAPQAPIEIVRPQNRTRATNPPATPQRRPQRPLQGNNLFENLQRLFGN
ncbi:MAG: AsmA-like C-terminal region-containing protein, partial [Rhizobiaceae bacterium]